jgi:aspartyl-tRNA(Asn)/glutamyl-tRNA(Gln) amidotransferase subunit C
MENIEAIVSHVEKLARLRIPDSERERFADQLGSILDMVAKLDELDTTDVSPTAHILSLNNVMRPDVPHPSLDRETILKLAPDTDGPFFKVPTVIQES